MQTSVPCVAALVLLSFIFLLSRNLRPPKLKRRPLPVEDLQPRSLRGLHDDLVRGSIKMELPVDKETETSWRLPTRVHFTWVGSLIRKKYVDNINNFCNHNPEYQVIYKKCIIHSSPHLETGPIPSSPIQSHPKPKSPLSETKIY